LINNYVRVIGGVPTVLDFTSPVGTPVIINSVTGYAYYMHNNTVEPILPYGSSVAGAFSSGFSSGFS